MSSPKIRKKRTYTGNFCSGPRCSNQSGNDKVLGFKRSYYLFPSAKHNAQRKAWIRAISLHRKDWTPTEYTRICSDHFKNGKRSNIAGTDGYAPTLFQFESQVNEDVQSRSSKTSMKAVFSPENESSPTIRKQGKKRKLCFTGGPNEQVKKSEDNEFNVWQNDHDYLKTNCLHYVPTYEECLQVENEQLRKQIVTLKNKNLSLETVKNFSVWTNMPNRRVFYALANYLKKRGADHIQYWRGKDTLKHKHHLDLGLKMKPGPTRKMNFDEELFLVLVKLKSGLNNVELAQLFDASETVIGQIFSSLINFLNIELKLLFEMPHTEDEEAISCFKYFDQLKIILDCTEISCERAGNLTGRKQLYSHYKKKETVKFMVGLGPYLNVNFVSKAYGGKASDKHITLESSALLNCLHTGESVMTDRGFNIGDELRKIGVKLIIPSFKGRNRSQLTKAELNNSEFISSTRIHIERVIQRIRTYQILEKTVKLSSRDIVEQIFTVCSYLTNFQTPIIQ